MRHEINMLKLVMLLKHGYPRPEWASVSMVREAMRRIRRGA